MERRERPYDAFIARMQAKRLFDWRAPSPSEKSPDAKSEKEKSDWSGWIGQFWKTVALVYVSLIVFGIFAYSILDLIDDTLHKKIIVEPIAVPKILADKGYTPETAARQFRDTLVKIGRASDRRIEDVDVDMKSEIPNISVPGLGVPLESVATLIHALKRLGPNSPVSGEIIYADNKLRLRLLKDGSELIHETATDDVDRPEKLIEAAAREYMRQLDPLSFSIFLYPNDPDEAIKTVRSFIERLPENHPAVARAHDTLGDFFRRSDRKECKWPERDESRLQRALTEYERAIELDPSFARPHNGRGLVLADGGIQTYEEAKREFRKAIAIAPDFAAPYNNLGVFQRRFEGDRRDSKISENVIANYRKAIELAPNNGVHHYNYGLFLKDLDRNDEAMTEFKKAIELSPTFASPRIAFGQALRDHKGRPDDAMFEFDRAFEVDRCAGSAPYQKGLTLHFYLSKDDEAIREYERAMEIDPKFDEPAYYRGLILFCNRSDRKAAVDAFRQAVERKPENAWYKISLGVALQDAGRKDEGEKAIRDAAAMKSDSGYVHNFRGEILLARKDIEGARAEFKQAIALNPRLAAAYYNLGKIYRGEHQVDDALANFEHAEALAPDDADIRTDHDNLLKEAGRQRAAFTEQPIDSVRKANAPASNERCAPGWKAVCATKPQS
jgi:tetratricopeptide (TPR) repeat protein